MYGTISELLAHNGMLRKGGYTMILLSGNSVAVWKFAGTERAECVQTFAYASYARSYINAATDTEGGYDRVTQK